MANKPNNPNANTPLRQLNTFNAPERIKIPADPLKVYIDRNNTTIGNLLTLSARQTYSASSLQNQTLFDGVVVKIIEDPYDSSIQFTDQYESIVRSCQQTGKTFKAYKVYVYGLFDIFLKSKTFSLDAKDYEKINLLPTFFPIDNDPNLSTIPLNGKVTVTFSNVLELSNPTILSYTDNNVQGTATDDPFLVKSPNKISVDFKNLPIAVINPGEKVGNIETGNRKNKKKNGSWVVGLKEDTVRGIDISHRNPNFNIQEFVDSDEKNKFLIVKMQHAGSIVKHFERHWQNLNKINKEFYFGIYWWPEYYRTDFMTSQFDALKQNLKKYNYSERNLPICIDIEIERGNVPLENILQVCEMVQDITPGNKAPIIYSADWWWRKYNVPVDSRVTKYPLWVANWNVSRPTLPQPWSDFSIWQSGISTMVGRGGDASDAIDQNVFNGSLGEFKTIFKV